MLTEEYRMHTELFGSGRFLGFPVFITVLVSGGVWLLSQTGTAIETIIGGLFALVLFFGLQVGTIGLVGRDAMRDVLGDVTLLVFSARTLPLSRRRLLATFLAKDLVYYVVLFLTPVVVGFLPLALGSEFTLFEVGLLWVGLSATFALGAGGSLTLAGIATRSKPAVVVVVGSFVGALVYAPGAVLALSPYALYSSPSFETALTSTIGPTAVLVAGPLLFEPPQSGGVRRIERRTYRRLSSLGGGLTARPILAVARSSGSIWKVAFSLGVLFAVTALLLDRVVVATGIEPSAGIAFGTLLGLGSFTTYNWITQFENSREYLRYPKSYSRVFVGKLWAFLLLSFPTGVFYLGLASFWYPRLELLLGLVVFPLISIYVFGVTAYLTGVSPNELLFDTPLFVLYGGALSVVAVPLLVASLAFSEYPLIAAGLSVGLSVGASVVGVVLLLQSGSRWHDRLREE